MMFTVITYLGLVVALLVLAWGTIEVVNRFRRQQKRLDAQRMNTWVSFKPTPEELLDDQLAQASADSEEESLADIHKKAQQNGHYSESKKNL